MTEHRMTPTAGRTALMVVDMQNAFCTDGGSVASIGLDISMLKAAIAPCARLVEGARAAGIPIIFTRHIYRADYADGGVLVKYLPPRVGRAGSPGSRHSGC
ncbi:MAG: isochorismatase family protein [Proteobacteria bacterium]|nr:isochorismatase family protein [Pseudomonadota bacterium]